MKNYINLKINFNSFNKLYEFSTQLRLKILILYYKVCLIKIKYSQTFVNFFITFKFCLSLSFSWNPKVALSSVECYKLIVFF